MDKGVSTLWIEKGMAASKEVEDILSNGRVQLVEYESLETEYLKHTSMIASAPPMRKEKSCKGQGEDDQEPTAVRPEEALKDAVSKMERGHFRHLPVVDNDGKLIGMLSDHDIRLIRPSWHSSAKRMPRFSSGPLPCSKPRSSIQFR